jgi:hypothetical protein
MKAPAADAERFEATGNNPLAWWYSADTLLRAAEPLRPTTTPQDTPFAIDVMDARAAVYGMLLGYAMNACLRPDGRLIGTD